MFGRKFQKLRKKYFSRKQRSLNLIQANYSKYSSSLEILRNENIDYPRNISIETLVKCNASCSFCPYPSSPRKGQRMPDDIFLKIINDLKDLPKEHAFGITLSRINEPLLDDRIEKFSSIIAENFPHATQQFWTNGTMLTEGTFEWMAQYPMSNLNVSLNSIVENEHIEMMGFGLEKVLSGLDYLHSLKEKKLFNLRVYLCAPFINDSQAERYSSYCKTRWPKFVPALRPFFAWSGESAAGMEERYNNSFLSAKAKNVLGFACGQWFDLHILASGYTTKCCIDETGHEGNASFDVRRRNVLEIYRANNQKRKSLIARGMIKECQDCLHLG